MKNTIIGVIVVIAAIALGVGGAYLAVRPWAADNSVQTGQDERQLPYFRQGRGMWPFGPQTEDRLGPGMMDRFGRGQGKGNMGPGIMDRFGRGQSRGNMGPGMMGGWFQRDLNTDGERISVDDALTKAEEYIAAQGDNLRVAEIMEFSRNYYAVVVEADSGRGAFELLVDPISGAVMPEPGPNMMWNTKYGHMVQAEPSAVNTVSMTEAAALAQTALDEKGQGAEVSAAGIDFYGYYSFDYEIDGVPAGMLSVNGETGSVWFHNWHGEFISEMEIEQ